MGDNVFIFSDNRRRRINNGLYLPTMITPKCASNSFPKPQ